jgi:hypothetical protein
MKGGLGKIYKKGVCDGRKMKRMKREGISAS